MNLPSVKPVAEVKYTLVVSRLYPGARDFKSEVMVLNKEDFERYWKEQEEKQHVRLTREGE